MNPIRLLIPSFHRIANNDSKPGQKTTYMSGIAIEVWVTRSESRRRQKQMKKKKEEEEEEEEEKGSIAHRHNPRRSPHT
jgi:hypothetical protein